MDFKERINSLMKEKNITQQMLAEIVNTTQATLSRNMNGVHAPKAEMIEKMADFFDVSSDYLLGLSNERKPRKKSYKKEIDGIKVTLYEQTEDLTEEQTKEVIEYIKYLKSKGKL